MECFGYPSLCKMFSGVYKCCNVLTLTSQRTQLLWAQLPLSRDRWDLAHADSIQATKANTGVTCIFEIDHQFLAEIAAHIDAVFFNRLLHGVSECLLWSRDAGSHAEGLLLCLPKNYPKNKRANLWKFRSGIVWRSLKIVQIIDHILSEVRKIIEKRSIINEQVAWGK